MTRSETFRVLQAENQIANPKNYANRFFSNKASTGWVDIKTVKNSSKREKSRPLKGFTGVSRGALLLGAAI